MKLKLVTPLTPPYAPGTFEIVPWVGHLPPSGEAELTIVHPECTFDRCTIKIRKGDPQPPTHHGWDGNYEEPTILPSIGCDFRCGLHSNLARGELTWVGVPRRKRG